MATPSVFALARASCRFEKLSLEEVTTEINNIKAPLQQLLQAATKAERSIKAAKDQLKKRLLQQAAAQTKKGKDDAAAGRLAIFDQGVAAATQLQRLSMDDVSKKTDMSFDVPFVVQGTDWLAKAVESVQSQLDGFTASFDIARTQRTALRASKVVMTIRPRRRGTCKARCSIFSRRLKPWCRLIRQVLH